MQKNKITKMMSIVWMVVFIAIFLILTGRFLYIQATGEVAGEPLEAWAESKRTNEYELPAQRGTIYDRNGMPLAQERITYRLQAIVDEAYTSDEENPRHVVNPGKTAELIAPILSLEVSEVKSILLNGIENDRFQVEFGNDGKDLSQEIKEEIEELELPGIIFAEESKRYYPNGTFASHILGIAQKKDGIIQGVSGIEKQMNDILTGKNGSISYQRDKYNIKLLEPNEIIQQPKDGFDVYLTIDQKIQTFLEDAMTQVEEEYNPKRMTAIVMDPNSGEILASSTRPSFNPNQIGQVENWYNDVISTPFEPGSTMKIFTLAAAIEEGVYNPNEKYQSGSYINEYMNRPIEDHNGGKGWGKITYDEGIHRSSNVAVAKLVWGKLGTQKFLDYLHAFDFDQPTGVDLPGEQQGYILYNRPIEQITASFGQGLTVTPIQQMKAATAIASDGDMMLPYVTSKVVNSSDGKTVQETKSEIVGNPISKQTAEKVRDTLERVITEEHGTGHDIYNLTDYSVAGKTGTAQIPDPDGPGYLWGHGNYTYSFLGMAPKEDPELIMYVSVTQPGLDGNELGSHPVSFIFNNVMESSLHYLNIQPDKLAVDPVQTIELSEVIGKNIDTVKTDFAKQNLHVTVIGNGSDIVKAYPSTGEHVLPNERIILITDNPSMPDLTGWSMRDVLKLGDLLELEISFSGMGYVQNQSIPPGKAINNKDYLTVELSSREKEQEIKQSEEQEQESVTEQ